LRPTSDHPQRRRDSYGLLVGVAGSPVAILIGAVWGFAESTLFFIVPDVWLGFVAIFARRWAGAVLVAAIVGAVIGSVALWYWSLASGPVVYRLLLELPGLNEVDLMQARGALVSQGAPAIAFAWLQAVPIKVYVHEAALVGVPLADVLANVAFNRFVRLGLVVAVAAAAGRVLETPIRARAAVSVVAYVVLWLGLYAAYYALHGA
jgi:hypothetical protein